MFKGQVVWLDVGLQTQLPSVHLVAKTSFSEDCIEDLSSAFFMSGIQSTMMMN